MTFRAGFFKGTHTGVSGLYNRFVRFWTRGDYSHMILMFSDGNSASATYLGGGIAITPSLPDDNTQWDYIELPLELESTARNWFELHNGKAYDIMANLRFGFGFLPPGNDKYDCSESCMEALGFPAGWRFEPNAAYDVLITQYPSK